MKRILAVAAALAFAGSAQAAASLITNGSFESANGSGNTFIDGWTAGGGGVDWVSNSLWTASDGTHSLDLSSFTPGSISQSFATVIGQNYLVTFDMAGNTSMATGGDQFRTLGVDVGGGVTSYTFDITGHSNSNMGWAQQSYVFTASSTLTTLTFQSLTNNASGPALDNVSVSVPEPATWAMMVGGFGLIGAAMRRRRTALTA